MVHWARSWRRTNPRLRARRRQSALAACDIAYRDGLLPQGTPVWQRNYWDRVIRDDGEHERIAKYIRDNPANWKGDRFNR